MSIVLSILLFTIFSNASIETQEWFFNQSGDKHLALDFEKIKKEILLEETPFKSRWALIEMLGEHYNQEELKDFLKTCLTSKEWFLQIPALKIYSKHHPTEAIYYAKDLIKKSKALLVRSAAVEVLGDLGNASDAEFLWNHINDRSNFRKRQSLWVREQMARAIVKLEKEKPSLDKWKEFKLDSDKKIKSIANKFIELN